MRVVFTLTEKGNYARIFNEVRQVVLKSGLPFEPAKVNKNWPRLAYGPVLGYGQESLGEYLDVYLSRSLTQKEVFDALTAAAGETVRILRVQKVPYALPSVANLASVSRYLVKGDFKLYAPAKTPEEFFGGSTVRAGLKADNGFTQELDLKPFIVGCEQPQKDCLRLTLQADGDKSLKPEYAVAAWLGLEIPAQGEFTVSGLKFIREGLYWRDSQGQLRPVC